MGARQMASIATAAPRCTRTPMVFCVAHLARTGARVPGDRFIDGEAFCRACFDGEPISAAGKPQRKNEPAAASRFESVARRPADCGTSPGPDAVAVAIPRKTSVKFRGCRFGSTDGIPKSHRLTALETKLLTALQEVLLHQDRLLEVFQKYRIPIAGRKKKAATARRGGRSQRNWQISLQPTPIVRQA